MPMLHPYSGTEICILYYHYYWTCERQSSNVAGRVTGRAPGLHKPAWEIQMFASNSVNALKTFKYQFRKLSLQQWICTRATNVQRKPTSTLATPLPGPESAAIAPALTQNLGPSEHRYARRLNCQRQNESANWT